MEKFDQIIKKMMTGTYLDHHGLVYKSLPPFALLPHEVVPFALHKSSLAGRDGRFKSLNGLKSFNDAPLFYASLSYELKGLMFLYLRTLYEDLWTKGDTIGTRHLPTMLQSRVYSEIEGTLSIESVKTSRRRIGEISMGKREPQDKDDIIVSNMLKGIDFVLGKPSFDEVNLRRLYSLLSEGCLSKEDELQEGALYRHDDVEVDHYIGCPPSKIKECMDSLFSYVESVLKGKDITERVLLPHIVHYYIVYIHPYFDYNGRTARMVSFWVSLLAEERTPPFLSEAIYQTKSKYYEAIEDSRDSLNDLTYFLIYALKMSIGYYNCYLNVECAENRLKGKGGSLSESDKAYLRKILISSKGRFNHSDFSSWTKTEMSKQGALKLLNSFVSQGLLRASEGKNGSKLFEVDPSLLTYRMPEFRP